MTSARQPDIDPGLLTYDEYQEFGAENRATGHKLVLRITKVW